MSYKINYVDQLEKLDESIKGDGSSIKEYIFSLNYLQVLATFYIPSDTYNKIHINN